jgi:hypothetical protein
LNFSSWDSAVLFRFTPSFVSSGLGFGLRVCCNLFQLLDRFATATSAMVSCRFSALLCASGESIWHFFLHDRPAAGPTVRLNAGLHRLSHAKSHQDQQVQLSLGIASLVIFPNPHRLLQAFLGQGGAYILPTISTRREDEPVPCPTMIDHNCPASSAQLRLHMQISTS